MLVELQKAEEIVEKHANLFWNGWDIVIANPTIDGYSNRSGIFFDGKWCTKRVVGPNSQGLYSIPARFATAVRTTSRRTGK